MELTQWDAQLLRKSTQLMFSGLPQTTKTRKFPVKRDKDSNTLCTFHTDVDETCLGVPRLSRVFAMCLVSNNSLCIDWFKRVS